MYCAQVGILEQMDEEGLARLLQRLDSLALPPEFMARREGEDRLCDLADEPCERQLEHQQVRRLLVPSDFTQCDRPRSEPVRFAPWDGVAGCGYFAVSNISMR